MVDMAKTSPTNNDHRQAAPDTYSAESLSAAARSVTEAQKVQLLKKAGILSPAGRLSKIYRNWGTKVSRTEASEGAASKNKHARTGRGRS